MVLVSIIIPTYNRFTSLLNTINSIKESTFTDYEIIVIDDCSTIGDYALHDWGDVIYHRLEENSRNSIGYACSGHVRNEGVKLASGEYLAFCDDDDVWLKSKLELQISAMRVTGCEMSSTESYIGIGEYNKIKRYPRLLSQHYFNIIAQKYIKHTPNKMFCAYPAIWDKEFLTIHNCCICSSIVMRKSIYDHIGGMKLIKQGLGVDYDCWLRALEYTDIAFVDKPLVYYDLGHAGKQWID